MSDAAWPSSPSFHYNTLHNKVLHSTCQWPLDGFSDPDFELSSDSEPTPKDGTTLAHYNLEPAPAEILYVLDHDSEVEMTIEDDCQFKSVFEPEELPYDNIDIDLPNVDMQVDGANASPLANEISNTDPEIRWQDGKRQGYCILCSEWIGLGQSKSFLYQFYRHSASASCQKMAQKKEREKTRKEEAHLQEQYFTTRMSPQFRAASISTTETDITSFSLSVMTHQSSPSPSTSPSSLFNTPLPPPEWTSDHDEPVTFESPEPTGLIPESSKCNGVILNWPVGTVFETYPWTQHEYGAKSLGYNFCAVEKNGKTFRIRSHKCSGFEGEGEDACCTCHSAQTTKARLMIEECAHVALPHTPYLFLTHQQLHELLRATNEQLNKYKLKVNTTQLSCCCVSFIF